MNIMKLENLVNKYGNRYNEEIKRLNLSENYITDKFKIGNIIEFWGGYDNNIRFQTKITGFRDNEIFVLWDCYWFPIRDDKRRCILLINTNSKSNNNLKTKIMFKDARVVMLPANKKSNYPLLLSDSNELCKPVAYINSFKPQHLYVITNDKIEKGDWYLDFRIVTNPIISNTPMHDLKINSCKKIIATTNELLQPFKEQTVKGFANLPLPSKSFIEKYIEQYNKGNKITDIVIEYVNNEKEELLVKNDNTITIKKSKDTFSKEEVVKLLKLSITECYSYPERFSTGICTDIDKINTWIETQLNKYNNSNH